MRSLLVALVLLMGACGEAMVGDDVDAEAARLLVQERSGPGEFIELDGHSVSGTVEVHVTTPIPVGELHLRLDGATEPVAVAAGPPFAFELDSMLLPDGPHELAAWVPRGAHGNMAPIARASFVVDNSVSEEPPPPAEPDPVDPVDPDPVDPVSRDLGVVPAVLWGPSLSWSVPLDEVAGNPFDALATVTFTHTDTREQRVVEAYFAGDETWSWRFAPSQIGTWTFTVTSDIAGLNGWHGEVEVTPNADARARGFLTASDGRFAQPTADGELQGRLYNVFLDPNTGTHLHDFPLDPTARARTINAALDRVQEHGMDALFISVAHGWLEYGALSYRDHDSENPSLDSFEVLDSLIQAAHARDLHIHLWAWGDEDRQRTPIGIGGINGPTDQRLQRYIAARLGPLPGWTMSYAFDLEEWITPEQIRSWATYLHERLAWPHLLMARETHTEKTGDTFTLTNQPLDVASNDERPTQDFYATAHELLASDKPVLFERRFLHTRDNVWDMTTTRRALWQFTLAGGAGAIWGPLWDAPDYPNPEQLRTHQTFWRQHFDLDLTRTNHTNDTVTVYALHNETGTRTIHYAENTNHIPLDLTHMNGPQQATAIDTTRPYQEINLGTLNPTQHTWNAPYTSDWAITTRSNR